MNVIGNASTTRCSPSVREAGSRRRGRCRARPSARRPCARRAALTASSPTLWRVPAYFSPGLPSPTTSQSNGVALADAPEQAHRQPRRPIWRRVRVVHSAHHVGRQRSSDRGASDHSPSASPLRLPQRLRRMPLPQRLRRRFLGIGRAVRVTSTVTTGGVGLGRRPRRRPAAGCLRCG